jgi:hypothetical protein
LEVLLEQLLGGAANADIRAIAVEDVVAVERLMPAATAGLAKSAAAAAATTTAMAMAAAAAHPFHVHVSGVRRLAKAPRPGCPRRKRVTIGLYRCDRRIRTDDIPEGTRTR